MRMKTLAMKKLRRTLMPPMKSNRKRLSLGMLGALERSRMMKPRPPMVKRKLEASPSMMYWPLTLENTSAEFTARLRRAEPIVQSSDKDNVLRVQVKDWGGTGAVALGFKVLDGYLYARNATGRWCPCSSVIEPTLGGSTMTS